MRKGRQVSQGVGMLGESESNRDVYGGCIGDEELDGNPSLATLWPFKWGGNVF